MKLDKKMMCVKAEYFQKVEIPEKLKVYFWDCSDGKTYLEKFILKIR